MQIPGGITYLRKISCVFLRLLLQWFSIIVCYYLQPLLYSVLPYGVLRCLAVSCHVMSSCCGIMCRTCHVVSCHAISFRVSLSLREVSCSAASCIVLFLCHDVLCRAVCCCHVTSIITHNCSHTVSTFLPNRIFANLSAQKKKFVSLMEKVTPVFVRILDSREKDAMKVHTVW